MDSTWRKLKNWIYCIYFVIVVYIVAIWYNTLQYVTPHKKAKFTREAGRVALITGGGTGIGYETAKKLLERGMIVVIAGRKADQKEGVENLQKKYNTRVKFIECDLSSLKSVRKASSSFKSLALPLHILINNAGIMFANQEETEDGFELHWQINHLSHFLLTHLLLNSLIKSATSSVPSRIVNLSSCLHIPGTINFDDINLRNCYSGELAYCQSKLAMLLFSNALAIRLRNDNVPVLINSVHPAVAFSGLYKYSWLLKYNSFIMKRITKTPEMASDTVVHAATSKEVKKGGDYYDNCQLRVPSKEARSLIVAEKLWKLSCNQVGIKVNEVYDIIRKTK
ncbi:UNVERIFIED_CONTAM: hypothetical protein RMT77_013186 [Armadillidium vulgare]